ncbi:hypothetical protein F8S13_02305 [Chloroflexia bacterium SDU3-3]|nr:hypothetical protein F8S13_02305 [Chloroflexia bacterium SDU3-3]
MASQRLLGYDHANRDHTQGAFVMPLRHTFLSACAALGATLLALVAMWLFGPSALRAAPAPQEAGCAAASCVYIPMISRPVRIQQLGAIRTGVTALDVLGDRVYYDGDGTLRIADISDPAAPAEVGTLIGDRQAITEIHAVGARLYTKSEFRLSACCISTTLGLWDIGQPDVASQIGALPTYQVNRIAVDGSHLYAISLFWAGPQSPELATYVISDSGYLKSGEAKSGGGYSVAASAGYAYVGAADGVDIFDISDSAHPQLVATIPVTESIVALDAKRLYVVNDSGLSIWDVSSPAAPAKLGELAGIPRAADVFAQARRLYLAQSAAGISLIDVADPAAPQLLARYDTPGTANIIRVSGDRIVVADGDGGLRILRAE